MPVELNGEKLLGNQVKARRRRLYLTGEEDAPPFAALEAYAVRFDGSIAVRQPTRDDIPNQHIFFNGPSTARADSAISGTKTLPTLAAYNDAVAEVSNRENVGTKAGDWRLHRGYEGFIAIGPLVGVSTVIMVMPWNMCRDVTAGGYYGYYPRQVQYIPINCCPGVSLPDTFSIKIDGTAAHDGEYPVVYQAAAPALQPLEFLWNYYSVAGEGVWMSDLYQEADAVMIDCELESPPGCPYTMRITYTFYNVYLANTYCTVAAAQFWKVDSELVVPPPGGCPTPATGSVWSTEGGFPSFGGLEAQGGSTCGIQDCDPVHFKFPLGGTTAGIPSTWLYNFALTGCITSTQDYEVTGGCSGAVLAPPYAEIVIV